MTQWRIVRDRFCGYEVQHRTWWWPFWRMHRVNTHATLDAAKKYINAARGEVVFTYSEDL